MKILAWMLILGSACIVALISWAGFGTPGAISGFLLGVLFAMWMAR